MLIKLTRLSIDGKGTVFFDISNLEAFFWVKKNRVVMSYELKVMSYEFFKKHKRHKGSAKGTKKTTFAPLR